MNIRGLYAFRLHLQGHPARSSLNHLSQSNIHPWEVFLHMAPLVANKDLITSSKFSPGYFSTFFNIETSGG